MRPNSAVLPERLTGPVYHPQPPEIAPRAHISRGGHAQPCGHPSPGPPPGPRYASPGGPLSDRALVPSSATRSSRSSPTRSSTGAPLRAPSVSLAPLEPEDPSTRTNVSCNKISADEDCVNKALTPGRFLGFPNIMNNCQTFTTKTVLSCGGSPAETMAPNQTIPWAADVFDLYLFSQVGPFWSPLSPWY